MSPVSRRRRPCKYRQVSLRCTPCLCSSGVAYRNQSGPIDALPVLTGHASASFRYGWRSSSGPSCRLSLHYTNALPNMAKHYRALNMLREPFAPFQIQDPRTLPPPDSCHRYLPPRQCAINRIAITSAYISKYTLHLSSIRSSSGGQTADQEAPAANYQPVPRPF